MAQRPWSWTRIDGRNVLAVPVRAAVHLYDSDDFILLHAIAARDASPVRLVRFSAFHGKLAALSAARIVVHAPQRRADRAVAYVPLCDFSLAAGGAAIRGLSFSRCADQLLVCGDGIAVLDVHALAHSELHLWTDHGGSGAYSDEARLRMWERKQEPADVAKFSPSAAVFASLAVDAPAVKVWRMKRAAAHLPTHGSSIVAAGVQNLQHAGGDPIVYFSWKPAQTPRRAVLETDGCRRPEWFEPARLLLTCSAAARSICIWTEEQPAPGELPAFVPIVAFSPPHPIDNFRWVMSKSRSPSDERFREMEDGIGDWISGVDRNGVLRLWRVRGLRSYHSSAAASPSVEETPFQLQVDEDAATNLRYGEACVMAYFSPSHLGMPSKFNIVMERADRILLSFDVLVDVTVDVLRERVRGTNGASTLPSLRRSLGAQPAARIRKKSWFRTHVGSIAALAAHPSLPLVASVDTPRSGGRTEVLIYWLSFSAFSAETRLIPSGVLPCVDDEGKGVLCVQWIPTLHFDATPMLLVAYASGRVEVYGRSATAAGVVTSPVSDRSYTTESTSRGRRPSITKSPSTAPWTYFDYATGESGAEYEVEVVKRADNDSVVRVEESVDGRKLLIAESTDHVEEAMTSPTTGDELVAVDGQSVMGYRPDDVQRMLRKLPAGRVVSMRLRAHSRGSSPMPELTLATRSQDGLSTEPDPSTPGKNWVSSVPFMRRYSSKLVEEELNHSVDDHARELQRGFLSSLQASLPSTPSTADPYSPLASTLDPSSPRPDQSASIVHAGSISTYGGWTSLLSTPVADQLALVCVCPAYADDGDYIPDSIILFGLSNLPGSLLAWKGVRSRDSNSFELRPLTVARGFVDAKHNITAISGERDYRQRAFSTAKTRSPSSRVDTEAFNSLLFVGDTNGSVEHWRCRVAEDEIHFTLMSAYQAADDSVNRPQPLGDEARVFNRRGYVASATAVLDGPAVLQIEVDDPNRIAVVRADRPHELSILEAESGLGILRLDECLAEGKIRGRILGFCWCAGHVEFNVDALVVNYSSGLVVYHFDTSNRQWTAMGDSIGGQLALFDCTRDASALLIGGGSFTGGAAADEENVSVSNEMPLVVGKWDEPGRLLQDAMDWKAPMVPQQLPVWHPFVVLTTLFGMHARVGEKDTALAADRVTYSFSRAFKDAVQMLKLLADVVMDAASTRRSARTGVLSAKKRADAVVVGRYSTAIHKPTDINKAELLFAPSTARRLDPILTEDPVEDLTTLSRQETQILHAALDVLLLGTDHSVKSNALLLFGSFETQHLVLMKAILSFVDAIQSLGFDLDASGADLGAKRFFAMHLFTKSLKSALDAYGVHQPTSSDNPAEDGTSTTMDERSREAPASAVLWALHSDAQRFIVDRCCLDPQLTWERHLGPMWLGLWIKDVKDLRDVVERFAKQAYARSRDAMQVCLYYVALGKSNILGALAKMARDDQNKKLAMFLENDFTQERWSSAAVKNAYSLLSKKRFEASAAFFLLCNPPRIQEAVRVLAVRLGDPSLALVIARLVEYRMSIDFKQDFMVESTQRGVTPAGDVAKRLIREDLIPLFRQRRDQWLESCAFWWLEEFEHACAIVSPTSQEVDVALNDHEDEVTTSPTNSDTLLHLHSCENTSALQWAKTRSNSRRFRLASVTDIEHAFAFAAYVCKRNGLSDTALVEMLQARHLINTHARLDEAAVESISSDVVADKIPTSPRLKSSPHRRLVVTTNGDLQVDKSALLSPRMGVSMRNMLVDRLSNTTSDDWVTSGGGAGGGWGASPRRMSDIHQAFSPTWRSPTGSPRGRRALHRSRTTSDWSDLVPNSDSSIKMEAAPWLKAQLADLECRRWSSSAFVGKMIGLRVAREMIAHFRADLDALFLHVAAESDIEDSSKNSTTCSSGHRKYLEELCAPLCTQFQVETAYVLEAALAVLQPHAHLHLAEVCFLLAQLHRHAALQKWIQYVALCVLRSCATFASCRVTDHVYRDWEGLTVQLCYLVHLDASGELALPPEVVAQVIVAVRTGILFLGWIRHRADIVRDAISRSFVVPTAGVSKLSSVAFSTHLALLRNLEKSIDDNASDSDEPNHSSRSSRAPAFDTKVGFTFLGSVAAYLADKDADDPSGAANWREMHTGVSRHQSKVRKMYSLVLLVSILRTLYARATSFLDAVAAAYSSDIRHAHAVNGTMDAKKELDIASSLFTPRKLWKDLGEGPLEGVKRWFALTESHLRFEFDYSVQELQCVCGLYGLDRAAVDLVSRFRRIITSRDEREPTHTSEEEVENGNDLSKSEEALLQQLEIRGLSRELHWSLAQTSDDYILLLLKANVLLSVRRFRADPRIYVDCFLLRDAFRWFTVCGIFDDPIADGHAFLARCCKQRKLRLLVAHRGQDSHLFPHSTSRPTSHSPGINGSVNGSASDDASSQTSEHESPLTAAFFHQAMMFVDPWEVEAVDSARRYIHGMAAPRHVELGRDRLSPLCDETCDEILTSVFARDTDLVGMWKEAHGEGWLVTAITQYQLDGVRSVRRRDNTLDGDEEEEEPRVPYLVEIHSRAQRNAMFQETGLPHRFVGIISVTLVEARDLPSCNWIAEGSDPYVFLELLHAHEIPRAEPDGWSVTAYRSRVSPGKSPAWGDEFVFRFAVPTHENHVRPTRRESSRSAAIATDLWAAHTVDPEDEAVDALESLLPPLFQGPPVVLHCAVFHKNKVLAHQLLGRTELELGALTSGTPVDRWLPLDGGKSGSLHVRASLSFQLMCSSVAGATELEALR